MSQRSRGRPTDANPKRFVVPDKKERNMIPAPGERWVSTGRWGAVRSLSCQHPNSKVQEYTPRRRYHQGVCYTGRGWVGYHIRVYPQGDCFRRLVVSNCDPPAVATIRGRPAERPSGEQTDEKRSSFLQRDCSQDLIHTDAHSAYLRRSVRTCQHSPPPDLTSVTGFQIFRSHD